MIVIIQSEQSNGTLTMEEKLSRMKSKISELEREICNANTNYHSDNTNEEKAEYRGRY